jgi:hypothetical protein
VGIPGFSEQLAILLAQRDVPGYSRTWKGQAVSKGLLPVYSDWACSYALTADGEPVYSEESDWLPLTNRRHRHVVFAQAAARYPALAELRPQRRPDDPACSTCGGTGQVRLPEGVERGVFICECGGLGWFPAGSELGPA